MRFNPRCRQRFKPRYLFAFCLLQPCGSVLLVYNQNDTPGHPTTTTRFDDVPSLDGFGPRVPEEGFAGRLQLAKPDIYACSALSAPVMVAEEAPTGESAQEEGAHNDAIDGKLWDKLGGGVDGGDGGGDGDGGTPVTALRQTSPGGAGLLGGRLGLPSVREEELPSAVLISRSVKGSPPECTFEAKVLNAQAAGFDMAIVFDSEQQNMFKMSMPKDSQHPAVEIPLVLVTHASGLALMTLIAGTSDRRGPEIYVDNADPFGMFVTVNLTMFMLVIGFLLALLTCGSMMVVTLHRYLRRYESLVAGADGDRPMSLPEVLNLEEVRVEEGSRLNGECCPVCLEPFKSGDKLRNLPCEHAFHGGCITPWLTQRRRSCPMCKDPITIRPPPSPSPAPSSSTPGPAVVAPPPAAYEAPAFTATGDGGGGSGGGGGGSAVAGDRLPLLSNSRGPASDGGSIQETSPV